jgi:GNAT superfamily N-acetyltransferase
MTLAPSSPSAPTVESAPEPDAGYPRRWECDVVLADGGTAHVRPIKGDDADALMDLHSRLSPESQYLRFFSAMPALSPPMAHYFTHLDYVDRVALVAEVDGRLVAVARYDRVGTTSAAEVAFVVVDQHQGRGLGTILLEQLAAAARDRGVARFTAETLANNSKMLHVFHAAGFREHVEFDGGVVKVVLDLGI